MSVKALFDDIKPEGLRTAMICGITEQGSFIIASEKNMTLKEMRFLRDMISENIVQLRAEELARKKR